MVAMRVVGSVLIILGLAAATVLLLLPTHVTVLGTTGDCGAPIVRVLSHDQSDDTNTQALINECRSQSWPHVIAGGIVGLVGIIGGILMVTAGAASLRPAPLPTPPPGWWWDGRQWRPGPPDRR
jgi:hypothetical protein